MEDRQMETSKTEKEWFRRINGQHPMTTDDKEAKQQTHPFNMPRKQ